MYLIDLTEIQSNLGSIDDFIWKRLEAVKLLKISLTHRKIVIPLFEYYENF
jgi:hypothetical protein